MHKVILTDKALAALKPADAGKRYVILDSLVHGLGVSVTDSGHRTHLRTEVFPQWRHRPVTELSRHDVLKLVGAIADRPAPAYARNILDDIRALFNWALNREDYGLENSPVDRVKPKAVLGAKAVRERVLDDDELRAIWRCY